MAAHEYLTRGGVTVTCTTQAVDADTEVARTIDALGDRAGCLLSSLVDFPGKYSRYDLALVDPPITLIRRHGELSVVANTPRGAVLKAWIEAALAAVPSHPEVTVDEELRTRRSPLFAALRAVRDLFGAPDDAYLGLYGAFGYDLVFELEPDIERHLDRGDEPDLVLHLPDRILVVDRKREEATLRSYDFARDGASTAGLDRPVVAAPYSPGGRAPRSFQPGSYAGIVEQAHPYFQRGDLFEVVPGHVLEAACPDPAAFYRRLMVGNPSPYAFLINLGDGESLVGSSPEMFVRVSGDYVESCPISGTVRRGADALEDAERVRELLGSAKDESELTMCTDVDRNDKSRVCVPGTVKVIGRRELEFYSRLIHTVDHVEGRLRPELDALDAFASHMWAVTVTGAPKRKAIEFIENHESTARGWYGGAVGALLFDGDINTGITLRTAAVRDGLARIRVGATLLNASDAEDEEAETLLKGSALMAAAGEPEPSEPTAVDTSTAPSDLDVLVIDFDDSFVNTLSDYFRQTGVRVRTVRWNAAAAEAGAGHDLVVLSPGPGAPAEYGMKGLIDAAVSAGSAVFGVCLGLQGLAEWAGGAVVPAGAINHGVASVATVDPAGAMFTGLPPTIEVGRYHSLVVSDVSLPAALTVRATTADGMIMAADADAVAVCGVQFHPESIMTAGGGHGRRLIDNVVAWAAGVSRARRGSAGPATASPAAG